MKKKILIALTAFITGIGIAYASSSEMSCTCDGPTDIEILPDGSIKIVCHGKLTCDLGTTNPPAGGGT